MLYLEFTDSHELTDEVVKYLDTNLRNFLDDLENNNHISKKTTVNYLFFFIKDNIFI